MFRFSLVKLDASETLNPVDNISFIATFSVKSDFSANLNILFSASKFKYLASFICILGTVILSGFIKFRSLLLQNFKKDLIVIA